jgi:7-cyano-7-deazaguanine synthase in queuosine biosynthesis
MHEFLPPVSPIEYHVDFTGVGVERRRSGSGPVAGGEDAFTTGFYLDDEMIGYPFCQNLDPLLADWVDVALFAYVADRLSPRRDPKNPQRMFQWARRMNLKVPVRRLDEWQQPGIAAAVCDLLRHFTDDEWHIEFVARRGRGRSAVHQGYLFSAPQSQPARVALYSGGLDSFAGAAQQCAELSDHSFVLVSGATNSRQRSAQREQIRALIRQYKREVCQVTVPFGINWRGKSHRGVEDVSQRTRGFLFATLGAVTAITAGSSDLYIYENGIGAINLPYDATQLGTSNSRAVHPLSLQRMSRFVELLTGSPFAFQNPYLFQTKGEMCRHPAVRGLANYVPLTFSCDGFPVQAKGKPQCGSCTSCLLRRLSLEAAKLSAFDRADDYICDLLTPGAKASERQLQNLRAMEWQYRKISQRLAGKSPWQSLVTEFPELQALASELSSNGESAESSAKIERSILRLYARYVAEWGKFSARERLGTRAQAA